jgi:hypothetical protein
VTQTIGDQLPINLIEEYGDIGYRVFILGLQSKSISTGICVFQMPLWCLLKCIADKFSKSKSGPQFYWNHYIFKKYKNTFQRRSFLKKIVKF